MKCYIIKYRKNIFKSLYWAGDNKWVANINGATKYESLRVLESLRQLQNIKGKVVEYNIK